MPYTKEQVDVVIEKMNVAVEFCRQLSNTDVDYPHITFSVNELKIILSNIKSNK